MKPVIALLLFSMTPAVLGQTSSDAVVLIPIYSLSHGALGSIWHSELRLRNDSDNRVLFTPLRCVVPCFGNAELSPHETRMEDSENPGGAYEGRIMRIRRDQLPSVAFSLRVKDLSRNELSAGTEIPVVREDQLRTRVILLNVPVEERFRQSLRIYDISNGSRVRLRIYPVYENTPLVDTTIGLTPPLSFTTPAQVAIHGLSAVYPQIAAAGDLRIEIDAIEPTQRLWAMASITNNETQEFTIVSPQ